jgi:transcriptional regulator with XRE-family HTH domain
MGDRLKQILRQKKIKVIDFAEMAGFTNQIAHYHLRKSDMKRSTMERFCELIGITPEEFMRWNIASTADGEVVHHGRRMQEIISVKGLNKSKLAARLNVSRRTMYNFFEKEFFPPDDLERVARGLDISVNGFLNPGMIEEGMKYTDNEELMTLREKYYKLLEENNHLLRENLAQKEELMQLRKELAKNRK